MRLREFFDKTFVPDWLQSCNRSVLHRYMLAVDWFELWHGTKSTVDDLADEKLKQFAQWLVDTKRAVNTTATKAGTTAKPAKHYASRLRQIRRYAAAKKTDCRRDLRLIDFFTKVYLKDTPLKQLSIATYRKAIASLSKYYGSEIMLSELTIEVFTGWKGKKANAKLQEVVVAVWRLAYMLGYVSTRPTEAMPTKPPAPIVTSGDSLRMLMTSRYFPGNLRIRDEKTKKQYCYAMNDFAAAIGHEPTLVDLTDDNVAALMRYLLDKQLSPKTVNERRGRINALWSWLAKRGMVSTWPTTAPIPEPERTPEGWDKEQIAKLFACCKYIPGTIGLVKASDWWFALHMLLWDSGGRITELIKCEWSHLRNGWLYVPAELRKGRKRDKAYELHTETLAALEKLRESEQSRIFHWPFTEDYLWTRYKAIRKKFGLPTDRRSSFHRMRRSVASYFEAAGGNATELLSHSSRAVTMKYIDPTIAKQPQAIDLLFRPNE